jgi:hypothetical protein
MALPSVRLLTNAVFTILDAHATLTVYRSVVDPVPPVDANAVTQSYAVLHPFGGDADANNLARIPGQLLWEFQVSCAGGNHDYTLGAVDVVRGLLDGKTLSVAGAVVGLMQPPPGFSPPPPKPQPVDSGQRLQVPLLYRVLAVA